MNDTFWLIERGPNQGSPQHLWWSQEHAARGSEPGWRTSVHEATKFPSKEAAESFAQCNFILPLDNYGAVVTSHGYMDAAPAAPVSAAVAAPTGARMPLTDAQLFEAWTRSQRVTGSDGKWALSPAIAHFARAIEKAHGIAPPVAQQEGSTQ